MFFFAVFSYARRTTKDYGNFGNDTFYVGTAIKEQTFTDEQLENHYTYLTAEARYSYIKSCVFTSFTKTAILFSKDANFWLRISQCFFTKCDATTNGGALCINAIDGGHVWLDSICGTLCSSSAGGQLIYAVTANITISYLSCIKCSTSTLTSNALYFSTKEFFNAEYINSSFNAASEGSIICLSSSPSATILYSSFENDTSKDDCPINVAATDVSFEYINIINIDSGGSIVLLDATSVILFKNVFCDALTIATQFVAGVTGSSVTFFNCRLDGITSINAPEVATVTTKKGVVPPDTYFIRFYETAECEMLHTVFTSTFSQTQEIIEEIKESEDSWWQWLVIGILTLLLILLILYMCLMFCPETVCCSCCCVCCCCTKCRIGDGKCVCRQRICDMKCGQCKCCRRITPGENGELSDISNPTGREVKVESKSFNQEIDTKEEKEDSPNKVSHDVIVIKDEE